MTEIDVSDIQGFALRGYNFPFARYLLLELLDAKAAQRFVGHVVSHITTGVTWDSGKPASTVNIAFTHPGLIQLGLPEETLLSFPVEFQQGMKARGEILGDTGKDARLLAKFRHLLSRADEGDRRLLLFMAKKMVRPKPS